MRSTEDFDEDIRCIKALKDADPEARHGDEDALMQDFITDVHQLAPYELARRRNAILSVVNEHVSRWYA